MDTQNLDFKYIVENQKQLKNNLKNKKEQIFEYDFKIVSFRIGKEFYGIDIMSVKEILKERKFTRVPNALDFVEGVINLRGIIAPVINLAKMFHLESTQKKDDLKSIIIIRVEGLLIGVIVDEINHVIPLRKADMQPPSPLLGKINERYIEGVIQLQNKLYVILDTDAIFSDKEKSKRDVLPEEADITEDFFNHFVHQLEEFGGIHVNEYNKKHIRHLYNDYIKTLSSTSTLPQLTKQQANAILSNFYSQYNSQLWDIPYTSFFTDRAGAELQKFCSDEVRILDLGCGSGQEALSVYFLVNKIFPDAKLELVAADVNLVAISNASGFEIMKKDIPSWIDISNYFMNISGDKYKIKKEINDSIYFEFHDITNINTFTKQFDLVIARDLSLNLSEEQYTSFLNNLTKRLIDNGLLIIGDKEEIPHHPNYTPISDNGMSIYKKSGVFDE